MKSLIARLWGHRLRFKLFAQHANALDTQIRVLNHILKASEGSLFYTQHRLKSDLSLQDFAEKVPVRDYEALNPWIKKVLRGQNKILMIERPAYFAKTSGTTSGDKYIPISKQGIKYQIQAAREALLIYANTVRDAGFVGGKMIFLQGSPDLEDSFGVPTGRLSGIVAHHIPSYLQKNRLPSWRTNCIQDWETKLEAIIHETKDMDMRLISGIPPWLVMYFEILNQRTGKKIGELFPKLQLLVTGGVNYEPYRHKIESLIGRSIDIVQTFPASEGFFAFQDQQDSEDMLLLLDHGIYYEFIPLEHYGKSDAPRLNISQVELDKDYAMVITTISGLFAYDIGDVIRFTHLSPYRVVVSGRTKHFTSAFGEHIIAIEAERALKKTVELTGLKVREFHLAPQVNPPDGLPYHEWFIEWEDQPTEEESLDFAQKLDEEMQGQNTYYKDLVKGNILRSLKIRGLKSGTFLELARMQGKLGGQNKMVRLANHRDLAIKLESFL